MIVLRLFHVVGGALCFGSAFLFTGFVGPAAAETVPASGAVMAPSSRSDAQPRS